MYAPAKRPFERYVLHVLFKHQSLGDEHTKTHGSSSYLQYRNGSMWFHYLHQYPHSNPLCLFRSQKYTVWCDKKKNVMLKLRSNHVRCNYWSFGKNPVLQFCKRWIWPFFGLIFFCLRKLTPLEKETPFEKGENTLPKGTNFGLPPVRPLDGLTDTSGAPFLGGVRQLSHFFDVMKTHEPNRPFFFQWENLSCFHVIS